MMRKISIRSFGLATALVGLSMLGGATVAGATPITKALPAGVPEISGGTLGVQLVHQRRRAHSHGRRAHRKAHRKGRRAHRRAHRKHRQHRRWIYSRKKHGHRHRNRRHGFHHYHLGYWYASPFWAAAIASPYYYGGGYNRSYHVDWCLDNYRSYRVRTNTYRGYDGYDHECVSPYSY